MAKRFTSQEDAIILHNVDMQCIERSCESISFLLPSRTHESIISRHKKLRGIVSGKKSPRAIQLNNEKRNMNKALTRDSVNTYKSWKLSDIAFLKTSKLPRMEQAKALGRSYESVCNMVRRINKQEKTQ